METYNTDKFKNKIDVAILGGGPAGLSAGIFASRKGLNTMIFSGHDGSLINADSIENYPGFPDGISGSEIIERMQTQALLNGASILHENACEVNLTTDPKWISTDNGEQFFADAVIIATGTRPKHLGIDGEKEFWGKGVSTCSTCDGPLYKNKNVVVVGGGDKAFYEALHLADMDAEVDLVYRGEEFKADNTLQNKVKTHPNIIIIPNSEITRIDGNERVKSITLYNNQTQEQYTKNIDGVFVTIGADANSDLFKGQIELDENGYIKTDDNLETSQKGVYAAGDVRKSKYKQAILASAEGAIATMNL